MDKKFDRVKAEGITQCTTIDTYSPGGHVPFGVTHIEGGSKKAEPR